MGLFQTLLFQIKGDANNFKGAMRQSGQAAERFGSMVKTQIAGTLAAAFSVHQITKWTSAAIANAQRIKDLGDQAGITNTEVQQIGHALDFAGLKMESFITALDRLTVARREAAEGSKKSADSFLALGVSMATVTDAGTRSIDIFKQISSSLGGRVLNPVQRAALAQVAGARGAKISGAFGSLGQNAPGQISDADVGTLDAIGKAASIAGKFALGKVSGFIGRNVRRAQALRRDQQVNPILNTIARIGDIIGIVEHEVGVQEKRASLAGAGNLDISGIGPGSKPQQEAQFRAILRKSQNNLAAIGGFGASGGPQRVIRIQEDIKRAVEKTERSTAQIKESVDAIGSPI